MSEHCPDCEPVDTSGAPLSRRRFLHRAAITTATAMLPWDLDAIADTAKKAPETLSRELFIALKRTNSSQLEQMLHPADSVMRRQVHANWDASRIRIGDLAPTQRSLAIKVLERAVTRDTYRRIRKQMRADAEGIHNYTVGFLGTPGHKDFQLMMAGRHFTLRVDGSYDDRMAFGGPILYGHAEERRAEMNVWHEHRVIAQGMFTLMTEPQRKAALVGGDPPNEFDLKIRPAGKRQGIKLSALKDTQRAEVVRIIRTLLGSYGAKALAEVDRIVKKNGGWGLMRLAFYSMPDKHADGVWDIWRVEGPGFMYFFRGMPHVHAYINIFEA